MGKSKEGTTGLHSFNTTHQAVTAMLQWLTKRGGLGLHHAQRNETKDRHETRTAGGVLNGWSKNIRKGGSTKASGRDVREKT